MSVPGPQTGKPTIDGEYCVEIYHGWRVLTFKEGLWYYQSAHPTWSAGEPVQWIGPLPDRVGTTPPLILGQDQVMEYDL